MISLPGDGCHGNHLGRTTESGQESEGGWGADAEGTNAKGGRKRGECRKKGQEEDGDHPRTVEKKHRISEIERCPATPPKAPPSFLEAAERPGLSQGHTTSFQVSSEPSPRPHDPQLLIWLTSRFGGRGE